jgi:GNAT superfamily N-acetyltransferase
MIESKSELRIRTALVQDAPELARLLSQLDFPADTEAILARWQDWNAAGNTALVLEGRDGRLAGTAVLHVMHVLHRPYPVGRISALVIDQGQRGRGLGRRLVAAAESALVAAGCGLMEITSNLRLTEAHAFYEHIGFPRTSIRFAKTLPAKR